MPSLSCAWTSQILLLQPINAQASPDRLLQIRPSRARPAGCPAPRRHGSGRRGSFSSDARRAAPEKRATLRRDVSASLVSRRRPRVSPARTRAWSRAVDSAAIRRRRQRRVTVHQVTEQIQHCPAVDLSSAATSCASSRVNHQRIHRAGETRSARRATAVRNSIRVRRAASGGAAASCECRQSRLSKRSSSRARTPSMPSSRTRAAANSIASGMPSSRRQISAIAACWRRSIASADQRPAPAQRTAPPPRPARPMSRSRQASQPVDLFLGGVHCFLTGDQHAQRRGACATMRDSIQRPRRAGVRSCRGLSSAVCFRSSETTFRGPVDHHWCVHRLPGRSLRRLVRRHSAPPARPTRRRRESLLAARSRQPAQAVSCQCRWRRRSILAHERAAVPPRRARRRRARTVAGDAAPDWWAPRHAGRSGCGIGVRRRIERRRIQLNHEAITASGNRRDRLRAQQLAQRRDVHLQIVFFDYDIGPDELKQFVLADRTVAPLN